MFAWCARCYRKRIVNVNVNILLAGLLAIGVLYAVMHFIHALGIDKHVAGKLSTDVKYVNMVASFLIDLVADLAVYYVLHWFANHAPRKFGRDLINPEYSDLTFLQDATKVQLERMVLSPVLYGIAMGLQYYLSKEHIADPPAAAAIGFFVGVSTARVLHTMWMLYDDRRRAKRMLAAVGTTRPIAPPPPAFSPESNGRPD